MRRCAYLALVLSALLFACQAGATPAPTLPSRSLKGWELYSWQESGGWRFALVPGTNRLKTTDEILHSPEAVTGVEALLPRLARLDKGEQIFWGMSRPDFDLPPEETIGMVQDACARSGLTLTVNRPK